MLNIDKLYQDRNWLKSQLRKISMIEISKRYNYPTTTLYRWKKKHKIILDYKCDICESVFKNRNNLVNHRVWHNLPENIKAQSIRRKRISNGNKGKTCSEKTKSILSKIHKGKTISIKHREILSKKMKGNKNCLGRQITETSRLKQSETMREKNNPNLDIDFFENINTEEKAYWLGFLYGDGNINKNRITIGLKRSDKEHIIRFLNDIKSNHKLYYNKKTESYYLSFSCRKMAQDLIKWDCIPEKSLKLKRVPDISKEFIRHFIRGYFDADGCVYIQKVRDKKNKQKIWESITITIAGNEPFIKEINRFLVKNNIFNHYNKLSYRDNIVVMSYNGRFAVPFLEYIYNNSTLYLERKYRKYINFKLKKELFK